MSRSLGEFTADGIVWASKARLSSVVVITDKTNDATVILYDNASAASGTKVFEGACPGADDSRHFDFGDAVDAKNGLYLDITGTGASCIVYMA